VKVLIKIGGTLLDSAESRQRLAAEIGQAAQSGLETVVVHGGGKQMTRFLEERGVESRFVNGLRVTTPEVLDAVLKIFAGSVNQELVAAFIAKGVQAVGLTGMDALLTEARQMNAELGFVGQPLRSDARLPQSFAEDRVRACGRLCGRRSTGQFTMSRGSDGRVGCIGNASRKTFLFDGCGWCLGKEKVIYPTITIDKCKNLIEQGIAKRRDAGETGSRHRSVTARCGRGGHRARWRYRHS